MTTDEDDEETHGGKSLRVASRAYRRGRKLRHSWHTPVSSRVVASREAAAGEDDVPPSADGFDGVDEPSELRGSLAAGIPSDAPTSPGMPLAHARGSELWPDAPGAEPPRASVRAPDFPPVAKDAPSIRVRESVVPSDSSSDQVRDRSSRLSRPPVPEFDLESLKRDRAPRPTPTPDAVAPARRSAPRAPWAPIDHYVENEAGIAPSEPPSDFGAGDHERFDHEPSTGDIRHSFEDRALEEGEAARASDAAGDQTPTHDLRKFATMDPGFDRREGDRFDDSDPAADERDDIEDPWDREEFGVDLDAASDAALGRYEFFDDSSAPVERAGLDGDDDEATEVATTPRRGSLSRPLGIGLGFVALGAAVWFARSTVTRGAASVEDSAAPVAASQSAVPPGPTSNVAPSAAPSFAAPSFVASSVPTAAPTPSAPPVTDTDFEAMRMEFVRLHSARKLDAAEEVARKMIEARADDALGYRCLGAALQDKGRDSQARAAYGDCVEHASRGDVAECVKLGGGARRPAR